MNKDRTLTAALFLFALSLLSIGITKDWRLVHEENGAVLAGFAVGHLHLGYAGTKFHNTFIDEDGLVIARYINHPPGIGLVLSGAFWLAQSGAPWVSRSAAIMFHLGSLALMLWLLSQFFPFRPALLGGFFMAVLPMGSFFGRMVNFEAFGFFFVMAQFAAYAHYRLRGSQTGFGVLCAGIIMGGLMDWLPLFFSLSLFLVEGWAWLRGKKNGRNMIFFALCGLGIFLFNVWHAYYAGGQSWEGIRECFRHVQFEETRELHRLKIFGAQVEYFRRYFSHAGLISFLLAAAALLFPKKKWSQGFLSVPNTALLRSLLFASLFGTLLYLLLMLSWARTHHYLQFYFFPCVIFSMVLLIQRMMEKRKAAPRLMTALLVVFFLDVVLVSAYTLHRRHMREGAYCLWKTREIRQATFPASQLFE